MKKIWILLILIPTLALVQCQIPKSNPDDQRDPLPNPIDEYIPDLIDESILLPETLDAYSLTWYLDSVMLDDYVLVYTYQPTKTRHVVKLEISDGTYMDVYEKIVDFEESAFVSEIRIETQGAATIGRDEYVRGTVTVKNDNKVDTNASARLRGRGNSTWYSYPKKPYRIKFDDRQSVLGMRSAKDYVLLAEYGDKSLLRNYLAFTIGDTSNLDYTFEYRFVELYINNIYQGVYLLTEQVEIDKNRLMIDDSNLPNGGFMIELEAWDRYNDFGVEGVEWVEIRHNQWETRAYMVQHPDPDDYTEDEMRAKTSYIKTYMENTIQSMKSGSYNNYIDVDQFIEYFMIMELTKNVDVDYSSVFFYKDLNGKLKVGPLWDFDISMGNGDYFPYEYWGWRAKEVSFYLRTLLENPTFKAQYKARFLEFLENADIWLNELALAQSKLAEAAERNFIEWSKPEYGGNIFDRYIWPNNQDMMMAKSFYAQYEYLASWLQARVNWLKTNLPNL